MRNEFFEELVQLFRTDESLFFLTGDTGFNLVEPIFKIAPKRALNVGVAEQNMIGIASGLANAGFVPVCYAITNFLIERCFEQIRNDICLHKYKTILVGTSTGYDNGPLGPTHHKLDDIGAVKVLPNLRVYSPSGKKSISLTLKEALDVDTASFIRISKRGIDEGKTVEDINHFIYQSEFHSVLVISHGAMVGNAMKAYDIYPHFSLFAMDRIKPLSKKKLQHLFDHYETIVILEDNFNSGLFNSICQWAVENRKIDRELVSIAPEERYEITVGDFEYLEKKHKLSPDEIVKKIRKLNEN